MRRRPKKMTIVRPNLLFAYVQRSRKVNGVTRTQRDIAEERSDQGRRAQQQSVGDWRHIPKLIFDVAQEQVHEFPSL